MNKSLIAHLAEAYQNYNAEHNVPPQPPARLLRLLRWLMPNGGTLLLVALLIATQSVWARPMQSVTSAPGPSATTVNYQGRLANSGGAPLTGSYGMTFALYDAPTGGNLIWGPESHAAVPVSSGLFNVGLGSQTSGGIPTSAWNGDRYLEIMVGGETLAPRELIRSVPIAGMALTVPDKAIKSRNAQLTVGRVVGYTTAGASMTLTLDYQDVPGTTVTLTPETNQTYLIFMTAGLDVVDGQANAELYIDGVAVASRAAIRGLGGEDLGTVSQTFLVNLDAGNHTMVLKSRLVSGTTGYIALPNTSLTYLAVSQ